MGKINEQIRELEMEIKELKERIKIDSTLIEDIKKGERTIYDVYPDFDNRVMYYTSVDWLKRRIMGAYDAIANRRYKISELYQERDWYEVYRNMPTESDLEKLINNGNYIIGIRL